MDVRAVGRTEIAIGLDGGESGGGVICGREPVDTIGDQRKRNSASCKNCPHRINEDHDRDS